MWPILGHHRAVATLEQSLRDGRLAHAYLLVGPQGVGKGTLALELARALNCRSSPPCGTCSPCRRIGAGNHPDVVVLALQGSEQELGIQRVRELQRDLHLKPFEGRCRVAILREVGHMSTEAANSLLKTLEEPPPDTVILLTTTDQEGVLPTIRSRCQRLDLYPVSRAALADYLQTARGLPQDQAERLAAYAQGCPGRALEALDRPEVLQGVAQSLAQLKELLQGDIETRLLLAERLAGSPGGAREVALESVRRWRTWWRDLLLIETGCGEALVFPEEAGDYGRLGRGLGLAQVRAALQATSRALDQLERNANPRLVLDVLVLGLPSLPLPGSPGQT